MSNFKFEGNLDGVSPRQLEFISGVLENRGFKDETVLIEAFGKAGDNYVSNMKRITIKKEGNNFKMVAKVAHTSELLRMLSVGKYLNEHIIYTEILKKYDELEKAADIPEAERLRIATCYGSLHEEPNEIILLEDLQESNFVMLDRFKSLTDDNVKLVLKNLAIFHSLSFVLRNKEPETYTELKSKLTSAIVMMFAAEQMMMYFAKMEGDLVAVVSDEKLKKLLKGSITQLSEHVKKNHAIDVDSKYSVIQHGDAWTNNFMFTLEGDKTTKCCLIDYQQSAENSPVADIQTLIFSCTDYETRSKHYHEWIDYYHDQLDKSLANFGLKANFVYPRDKFDADLKRHGKLSFGLTILFTAMMMTQAAQASKMNEAMQNDEINMGEVMEAIVSERDDASMGMFRDRLEGLIKSFVELGLL